MIRVKLVFSLPNTGMWDFIIVSPKDVDQWLRRWIDYGYDYVVTGDVPGRDVLERI
jgi:hypothetical protein